MVKLSTLASLHTVTKFLDEPLNVTVGVKRMGVQKLRISIEIAVFFGNGTR